MSEEPPLKTSRSSDTPLLAHTDISPSLSSDITSPLMSDTNPTSPKSIRLQDSLLISISSQWLRVLTKSCSGIKTFEHHKLKTELQTFVERVGYISYRFFQSTFPAIILFFKNVTFRINFGSSFCVSKIASFFDARIHSTFLIDHQSRLPEKTFPLCDTVELVQTNLSLVIKCDFLSEFSLHFLPRVQRLVIRVNSEDSLTLFCKSLMNNSTVKDLDLDFIDFLPSHANDLGVVFLHNTTLKKVKLSDRKCSLQNSDLIRLYTSLSKSSSIQKVRVSLIGKKQDDSSVILPLFSNDTFKCLTFPSYDSLDSRVLVALETNSSLEQLSIHCADYRTELLGKVLKFNTVLKRLYITEGSSPLTSICESLETNNTLRLFKISHFNQNPSEQDTNSLAAMLAKNTGLIAFCLSPFDCQTFSYAPIFQGLQQNSTIRNFYLLRLHFSSLIACFEMLYSRNYNCKFGFHPHSLDFSTGSIDFRDILYDNDISLLLKTLKKGTPIKRVKCREWHNPPLAKILENIELYTVYSVVDFTISPHSVNVDDGLFCISPFCHTEVSAEDISVIHSFLKTCQIDSLILRKCLFSQEAIISLRDLIRVNHTLFSVELSDSNLSDDDVLNIFGDIQPTSYLEVVNLDKNTLTFKTLVGLYRLITSADSMISDVQLAPYSLNLNCGLIVYPKDVAEEELGLLLNALKENVPIERVDCHDIRYESFLIVLYCIQIRCIKQSVIDLYFYPKVFSFENLEFSYFPQSKWPKLTTKEVSALRSFLVNLEVKKLSLSRCVFADDAINSLRDLIKDNEFLTSIDFNDCSLSDNIILQLFGEPQLNSSSKLTQIHLKHNSIGCEGAKVLAEVVKVNSNISKVFLQSNSIGNEGAMALAETLKNTSTISMMHLQSNSIGNEGAMALAQALKDNPVKVEINLRKNLVDHSTQQRVNSISSNRFRWSFW
ncbi:hypothetical protein GEMRC1_006245 [Eukaryota sp. GEM-RC1]